jgi:spermidine synthase
MASLLLIAFSCGWVLMSVEILGGRILAPDFGSGVYTWGSLISTFLVALSVGYGAGGWLSKRRPTFAVLAALVLLGGVLVALLPAITGPITEAIFARDLGDRAGPLVASLALFAAPGIVLGMISPFCVQLATASIEHAGQSSGTLYAVSTVGSTLGTLSTTFFLIPSMGVKHILLCDGGALVAIALLLWLATAVRGTAVATAVILLVSIVAPLSAQAAERTLVSRESPYARIVVVQDGTQRIMRFARKGILQEESRLDVASPWKMCNEYTAMMFAGVAFTEPHDVLVVGLGGGILPRHLRHYYPQARIDNVEIDPDVISVAQQFFDFRTDPLMTAVAQDGRVFIKRTPRRYDIVFLDAFNGLEIPFHLKTREFLQEVQRVLKPGGVIVSNLHRGPKLYDSERQTYAAVFPTSYGFAGTRSGNLVLVSVPSGGGSFTAAQLQARAAQLQAQHQFTFDLPAQIRKLDPKPDWNHAATVLTDDYAPVETLNRR